MKISKDNPCFYFTTVTHNRLDVFKTDKVKEIAAKAFDEARKSAKIESTPKSRFK